MPSWAFCLLLGAARAEKEYLLDTSKQTTELSRSGWHFPDSSKWQDVTSYDENRDMIRALQACPRQKSEDSWVISPFIDTKGARNVELEIKYAIRSCAKMSGSFCREKFSILVNQSTSLDRPRIAPSTQDTTQWTLVDTVASTEDITVEQINIGPLFGNGIFIAFVNTGACMELSHVKVSYKYCPAVVADFAEFGRTHTGATAASIINQEGVCVENAIQNGGKPSYHCGSDGFWRLSSASCNCKSGYQGDDDGQKCSECPAGTYKSSPGRGQCQRCPRNSSSRPGSKDCTCESGHFRAGSAGPCLALPGPVENLRAQSLNSTNVLLSWKRPRIGDETVYRVLCSECAEESSCMPCINVDLPTGTIDRTEVELANLDRSKEYRFEVQSENAASESALEAGYTTKKIAVTLARTIPNRLVVKNLRLLSLAHDSADFLLFFEEHPAAEGRKKIEIELIEELSNIRLKRIIETTESTFVLDKLQPQVQYSARVRVHPDSELAPGISASNWSESIRFKTTDDVLLRPYKRGSSTTTQWLAGIITGAILFSLTLLVIAVVLYRKRGDPQWLKGTRSSIEQFSVVTTSSHANNGHGTISGTVDLVPCSRQASILEGTGELPRDSLTIDVTLKSGRLGKISAGKLYGRPVAIKELLVTTEEQLNELKIMAQLDQPNTLRIEGFMTANYPKLVVMEMCESNLAEYFATEGPTMHPVAISKQIACGVAYLHTNQFILRHLGVDTVLVAGNTFKIKLSSKTDVEPVLDIVSNRGTDELSGYIPLRNSAPEVFTKGIFSQMSDVWALGVLMWSVCCRNTSVPFWGLSRRQLVDAVLSGWRLPPPDNCDFPELQEMHSLMLACWEENAELRPTSRDLRHKIEILLQDVNPPTQIAV